jgi:arabinogalactan oligomer / maltooligosaccharide transport system permease protein
VPSISAATLIPDKLTLHNFGILFHDPSTHYARWYANTMIIAATTAIFTVLLGALAAYAFSRFRFKGRRMGLLSLLLIQMFPQLLLIVALYLIVLQTGKVFGFLGLNTLTGLLVV